jgi:3-deoxy-D-manno-octulosonic-acid transferase
MYLLYSLALSLLFLALLPFFIYQAIRHGKYAGSFWQRMGRLPREVAGDGRKTVWVHTVSVGEFIAARPLIERLRRDFAGWRLVVSTTTATGQRLARAQPASLSDAVFYFPFDWRFASRRSLAQVNPQIVIILETELWPNFLRECRRRGVTTVLVNGRISPRSFSRYSKARRFISRVLGDLSLLVMQSEADAGRARLLGARDETVRVCGNLKYDVGAPGQTAPISNLKSEDLDGPAPDTIREIDFQFALSSSSNLIVAGSTAQGEEEALLAALKQVRRAPGLEGTRMVIAPRHPERFDEVASLIAGSGFRSARRSEAAGEAGMLKSADVILLDTIGELAAIYRFASAVFIGGSLVPRGGHNIIEPAVYARPIMVGPHTDNFRQIIADFAREEALVQVSEGGEGAATALAREAIRLLSDRAAAQAMGARAREILMKNRGATDCVITAIKTVTSDE